MLEDERQALEEDAMPSARVPEVELYYEANGVGAPLVLIAGFGASSVIWQPDFLNGMARSFRVITFDNRGTGRSDKPDAPVTVAQMADDAVGLLGSLGIGRVHVMGVSMGGFIAQELALRRPDAVDRLVLRCTHCGPPIRIPVPRELLTRRQLDGRGT